MGTCCSSPSADHPTTAKIVTPSGLLEEYSSPIPVSLVLGDDRCSFILCNSDDLFIGEYVPPLRAEDSVVPGGLYFVLPRKLLESPLSGADMAALANKASAAALQTKRKIVLTGDPYGTAGGTRVSPVKESGKSLLRKGSMKGSRLIRRLSYRLRLSAIRESPEQ